MRRFPGGVHPPRHKEATRDKAICPVLPGKELVYPLTQHIGAPAVPIVEKGDRVLMGQCIAKAAEGKLSVPIYSAVSGTVKAIEPRLTLSGQSENAIVIENDELDEMVPGVGEERDGSLLSPEEIVDAVEKAGIVGLGGAGFPTGVKLRGAMGKPMEYLLINGAECEPYLTEDYRLMLERTEQLIEGVKLWMRVFPEAKAVIGVEKDKPEAIRALQKAAEGTSIRIAALKSRYPQGSERSLMYAITGKKVATSVLPLAAGCLVQNVATVLAGYDAVYRNMPLIRRMMTVTGDAIANPGNFEVRIGTSYQTILEAAGGFSAEPEKILSGGPMTGMSMISLDVPVTKTAAALLAMRQDEVAKYPTTNCIRCGRCVQACPVRLVPQKMVRLVEQKDFDGFEAIGGKECIACGACSFGCPARIPLTQAFRYAKKELASRPKKEGGGK